MNTNTICLLVGALAIGTLTGCASKPAAGAATKPPDAGVEPAARALLDAVSASLGSARTIGVEAEHKVEPPLGLGVALDHAPIEIAVRRPNQFYAIQRAGAETREIAYDGHFLCVMHPGPKHYALEPLEAKTIEQFAQLVDERFGFRPPVAELLANDMPAEMLSGVTVARVLGRERVAGTRCEHLRLDQKGMIVELWVGATDKLPRRMLTTCTDLSGHPTLDVRFSKWHLNEPVDTSLFSKRPAADWVKVQMLKNK